MHGSLEEHAKFCAGATKEEDNNMMSSSSIQTRLANNGKGKQVMTTVSKESSDDSDFAGPVPGRFASHHRTWQQKDHVGFKLLKDSMQAICKVRAPRVEKKSWKEVVCSPVNSAEPPSHLVEAERQRAFNEKQAVHMLTETKAGYKKRGGRDDRTTETSGVQHKKHEDDMEDMVNTFPPHFYNTSPPPTGMHFTISQNSEYNSDLFAYKNMLGKEYLNEDSDPVRILEKDEEGSSHQNHKKTHSRSASLEKLLKAKRKRTKHAEPELIVNTNAPLVYGRRRLERNLKFEVKESGERRGETSQTKSRRQNSVSPGRSLRLSGHWVKNMAQPLGKTMGLHLSDAHKEYQLLMETLNGNLRQVTDETFVDEDLADKEDQGADPHHE